MASNFPLRSFNFCNRKGAVSEETFSYRSNSLVSPSFWKVNPLPKQFMLLRSNCCTSSKWMVPPGALLASATDTGRIVIEDEEEEAEEEKEEEDLLEKCQTVVEFNRVNSLLLVLHKSARSFSVDIEELELARTGPPLAMAWAGVDVHAWHRNLAYEVAVYVLLKSAIEVELFLSQNRDYNPSPVEKILSPMTEFLLDLIESRLSVKNPRLVQWFRIVEVPRVAEFFMPLFKQWSIEYAGSGVAGTITAITCCATLRKFISTRPSCAPFTDKIETGLTEIMGMAGDLVSVDKLHRLAIEAGFEEDFLSHFGTRILPSNNVDDTEFWIGLVQRKLSMAFERESVAKGRHVPSNMAQDSLATLGIFAYLGRESRLFLSRHYINDLDEQTNHLLSYLESGFVFMYPGFSSLSKYQLLMEVIIDEVGWLDFYAAYNCQWFQERKRSKQHPIQAEREVILYTVFTVCYDVISGFAHYTSSTQQVLDGNLLDFLLHSQGLLSACLEDYWAAYDPSYERPSGPKIGERWVGDPVPPNLIPGLTESLPSPQHHKARSDEFRKKEKHPQIHEETQGRGSSSSRPETSVNSGKPKSTRLIGIRKYVVKLIAASVDVWMGTQLLFVDFSDALRLTAKKLCGHKVTERERRKMQRTLSDFLTLIPVTILMLLPVSAVGHAAMFAAIKKYIPFLIPSPYSDERLNIVKQLKRTKKMEFERGTTSKVV